MNPGMEITGNNPKQKASGCQRRDRRKKKTAWHRDPTRHPGQLAGIRFSRKIAWRQGLRESVSKQHQPDHRAQTVFESRQGEVTILNRD
jgi:hypothetical protein